MEGTTKDKKEAIAYLKNWTGSMDDELYSLQDQSIECLYSVFKAFGYDESARIVINQNNWWELTVSGLIRELENQIETIKEMI